NRGWAARVGQVEQATRQGDRLGGAEHAAVEGDGVWPRGRVRLVDAVAQIADQTAAAATFAGAVDGERGRDPAILQRLQGQAGPPGWRLADRASDGGGEQVAGQ